MRVPALTNCEKSFIHSLLVQSDLRLDGRRSDVYRNIKITLGRDYGTCIASLGLTKVLAQISCDLVPPKESRPHEGFLYINVEMSPMGSLAFEAGRLGDRGIELTRLLERLLKDSTCVDTESLCIQAHEKVWQIRVDVHVLDDDGGLVDCCSAAAVAALTHFRRPDVSVVGEVVTVHPMEEKSPVPLGIYHHPIAVTYGITQPITETQKVLVADPTAKETDVLDGALVVAFNARKELCVLHCSGAVSVGKEMVLKCCSRGLQRALEIIDQIKEVINKDNKDRAKYLVPAGLCDLIGGAMLEQHASDWMSVQARKQFGPEEHQVQPTTSQETKPIIINGVVRSGEGAPSLMVEKGDKNRNVEDEDMQLVDDILAVQLDEQATKPETKTKKKRRKENAVSDLLDDIEQDIAQKGLENSLPPRKGKRESKFK